MAQQRIHTFQTNDTVNYVQTHSHLHSGNAYQSDMTSAAYNKAFEKFKSDLKGEAAQIVNSIHERQKTIDMIGKRAIQLVRFTRAVRHFQWDEAAEILGFKRDRRNRVVNLHNVRHTAKAFGDNWLEFHFGLKPLIGEIGRCVELLQADYPKLYIVRKASESKVWSDPPQNLGAYTKRVYHDLRIGSTVGAEVRITNPNLFLADQLGFVNPASWVWEAIPFSFLVDWFVNVGDFLEGIYPFPGVTLVNPFRTSYLLWQQDHKQYANPGYSGYMLWKGTVVQCDRVVGPFPGPTLRVDMPSRLSPSRATTAVSLLTKLLRE
jgi:hypothetical protein